MKSRITIEVDFNNNNQPVIEVYLVDTEDVRDRLLRAFFQKLEHVSDLCKVEFVANHVENGVTTFQRIHISPIAPADLPRPNNKTD